MDERFSPTIFLYGMALVLAVGKAFTLTILADPPETEARAEARDAAGLGEPQAPETSCNESSPASSKRADVGRSLKDR
jgi:hypothetical protein